MSYANDITSPELEIAGDAVGGGFFADAKNRHGDLNAMLDSSKDNLKMEAMKRIINMMAKGKDVSDLFPAVVKNVAAKNLELKKLVYVYLVRYAEEQQDLALLSISTFQRALKDPNQLIRASALRVLSSIRVHMIAPIMMLSLKESMRDMSPYVRKVTAHAIPKLFVLDPELKDQLVEVIDHLLADKTTLVVGSAVYAFEELCPDRTDLIHKHFRKLCHLLVDVDEWGQVVIINMLTRYARTQFTDPNEGEETDDRNQKFYSSTESETDEESEKEKKKKEQKKKAYQMDPDLRMLLRNTKPLLQSRSSAVVVAVSQLYYHLAPRNEVGVIAKALIRLLRGPREVQSVVLMNIATISAKRRNMFEPFLKSFFVRSSDPTHVKLLKLEILTNLATQTNISIILREFQTYVQMQDKDLAASAIDAIGRCAANIKEVTDVCLSGLVALMASKNETVVAQSVVVIKRLLQLQPSAHQDIIRSMAKLVDSVKVAAARASIVWLIGEYCQSVPTIAPDVLRKMAKSFIHEEETVKLQVINLAVKLLLTNPEQTQLLVQYVFTLAKYDQSYDLRDRARFLKNLVMPNKPNKLTQFAKTIFLTPKPAPLLESTFKGTSTSLEMSPYMSTSSSNYNKPLLDRDQFQLGTLSHYLNQRCSEYQDLPEFPETAPDSSVRDVEGYGITTTVPKVDSPHAKIGFSPIKGKRKTEKFYSDEESSEEDEDEEETENSSSEESDGAKSESSDQDEEESEESSEESEEESSSSEEELKHSAKKTEKQTKQQSKQKVATTTDLLLDFDFGSGDNPAPSTGSSALGLALQPLVPSAPGQLSSPEKKPTPAIAGFDEVQTAPAQLVPTRTHELIDKMTGQGVSVVYRFTRSPSLFSNKMTTVEVQWTNHGQKLLKIKQIDKKLQPGMQLEGFPGDGLNVTPNQAAAVTVGIDFFDTTQAAILEVSIEADEETGRKLTLTFNAPVGEQLEPLLFSPQQFKNEQTKLSGLNETSSKFSLAPNLSVDDFKSVSAKVYDVANVIQVQGIDDKLCYAGRTLSAKCPILITLSKATGSDVKLTVNCEKMVIGSMLFKQLKNVLTEN